MNQITLNQLCQLLNCDILTMERRDGTPSTLIELNKNPSAHTLRAMSDKVYDVTGHDGTAFLLLEREPSADD